MAVNEQAETVFCAGCESAGNFVGPIEATSLWVQEPDNHGGVVDIYALDGDGAKSSSTRVSQRIVDGAGGLDKINPTVLVRRIRQCRAGEVCRRQCPAVGVSALQSILSFRHER